MRSAVDEGETAGNRANRRSLFYLSGVDNDDGHAALRPLLGHAV